MRIEESEREGNEGKGSGEGGRVGRSGGGREGYR